MVAIVVHSESTSSPTTTSPMASSPLIFNTAKQLTLLLIITILTLSLILWLTELETIHCADELLNDRKFLSSLPPEFNLSTNSSLSTATSFLPFRATFTRSTVSSSSPPRFTLKLESPLLIGTIFSFIIKLTLNSSFH